MALFSFNSNVSSLNTQRRLAESTRELGTSFERLSSGLRINRASDDAAGLSVANSLRVDRAVANQAILNANDAVSLLAIAEGATESLSTILIRIRELATQSANGNLSNPQRDALQSEATALRDEYNRLLGDTKFNNLTLLDGNLASLTAQVGYGTQSAIAYTVGEGLGETVGTGSFDEANYNATKTSGGKSAIDVGDLDGDGNLDYVIADSSAGRVYSVMGNGDGTSTSGAALALSGATQISLADMNGDSTLDVVTGTSAGNITINFGNGSGGFVGLATLLGSTGAAINQIETYDFNGDGDLDIIYQYSGIIGIALSNGMGGYGALTNVGAGNQFGVGDFNGDGNLDFATTQGANNIVLIELGNGSGSFTAGTSTATSAGKGATLEIGDINNDGYDDIVTQKGTVVRMLQNDGTSGATFTEGAAISMTSGTLRSLGDFNNDGYLDLFSTHALNSASILFGNGEGGFSNETISTGTGNVATATAGAAGDFNNDGALDVIMANNLGNELLVNTTEKRATLKVIDISTQAAALSELDYLDQALQRVSNEQGTLGAATSRLSSTLSELFGEREYLAIAESVIRDADIASEAANLTRNQILQETGAAVLAQANQLSSILLSLLE
ncbi:MAG: VCBS repeat-containing protein [Bdellovibrionales bacterium]|nr:VCBS repeat-containing protein [Bdellovibrionales bacterium]